MATTLGPIGLDRRLRWLLVGRLGVAICGMAAILGVHLLRGSLRIPPGASDAYYTLLAACALNLVYLLVRRFFRGVLLLAWIQIVVDVALVSLLVYYTSVDGVFAYLYFATVIAAAMILSGRASLLVASTATVMLSVVYIAHYLRVHAAVLDPAAVAPPRVLADLQGLVVHLAFFSLSLHVVALLAGRLATEARRVRILNDEILQTMSDGVVTVDRGGRIAFVNRPARQLLGLPERERLEGLPFEALGAEPVGRLLHETLRTGVALQASIRVERPDGSAVALDVATSVMGDVDVRLRGVVAILHDTTLRDLAEEMGRRAERFRALAEMGAGMAHEIRNPLASIRGAAQALRDDADASGDARLQAVIVRESDRLEGIIDNFLRYARNKPPTPRDVRPADLLQEVAALLRSRPDMDRIVVDVEADGTGAESAWLDPDQMKQVLLNLGLNAVEAFGETPAASPRVAFRARYLTGAAESSGSNRRVVVEPPTEPGSPDPPPGAGEQSSSRSAIRVAVVGSRIRFEVADNGPGIDPAHQARLFDPFYSTKPRGTGMGLAIARRIVEAHGGTIQFETAPGEGTTYRIEIPA